MSSPSIQLVDRFVPVAGVARDIPLHVQVRQVLERVINEQFEDGQKFFPESQLIEQMNVSQGTVRRALTDLAQQGLLDRQVAKGSFVRKISRKKATSRIVGVFVPSFQSAFWAATLDRLSSLCQSQGDRFHLYHLRQGTAPGDLCDLIEYPPMQLGLVLLGGAEEVGELYRVLEERRYRAVAVDITGDSYPGPCVAVDNRAGMRLGMDHLVARGHRRVHLLVTEPGTEPSVRARIEAFLEHAAEHDLEAEVVDCGVERWQDSFNITYKRLPALFDRSPRPTAVFTCADNGAWAVLKWCAEQGISIPDEVAVIGFDDDRPSRFTQPALTSIAQPVDALAQAAMELLWQARPTAEHRLLTPSLVIRQST